MPKYVTKNQIVDTILAESKRVDSKLPRLAFNNEEQEITCENCGDRRATAFRYNASSASGADAVVFRWEPDLTRLVVRGHFCTECNWHEIYFMYPEIEGSVRENDPTDITEVELGTEELVSHSEGEDKIKRGDSL